jgi:predicted Zn-ribbon and HTH transcriptional regulator
MQSDTGQLIRCPNCTASDIRSSHRRKAWDRVMEILLAKPLRCRSCGKRFYKRVNPTQSQSRLVHF